LGVALLFGIEEGKEASIRRKKIREVSVPGSFRKTRTIREDREAKLIPVGEPY